MTVVKIPLFTVPTHNAAEKTGRGVKKLKIFCSALQLNINHALLRQAEIGKYYTSTHKAADAHVSRCAELLSQASLTCSSGCCTGNLVQSRGKNAGAY